MKTLEELKQEMADARAAARDASRATWDAAARDAAYARDAYNKKLKELADEDA